jgi:hypothetical protein
MDLSSVSFALKIDKIPLYLLSNKTTLLWSKEASKRSRLIIGLIHWWFSMKSHFSGLGLSENALQTIPAFFSVL